MQAPDHFVAKTQVGCAMLQGCSWREAIQAAGLQMSRATAYRLRQRMLARGEDGMSERRQGHPSKVCGAVRTWLEGYLVIHTNLGSYNIVVKVRCLSPGEIGTNREGC